MLIEETTQAAIKSALQRLPRGLEVLDQAYREAVTRIDSQPQGLSNLAKRVLSWITYAQRPLIIQELQHALAVETGDQELDETNLPSVDLMISACTGLITANPENNIIRLVHYTT